MVCHITATEFFVKTIGCEVLYENGSFGDPEGDQSEFETVFDMWTEQRADAIDTTDYLLYYS